MSTIHTNTVETSSGGPVTLTQQSAAKHWSVWTQVTTTALKDSFNASGITDVSSGYTTVNFTNNFQTQNYAYSGGAQGSGYSSPVFNQNSLSSKLTSGIQVRVLTNTANGLVDPDDVTMNIHGDLA